MRNSAYADLKKGRIVPYTIVATMLFVIVLLLGGCKSADEKARELFQQAEWHQAEYEEVINRYPDTRWARMARNIIAERLVKDGKYEEVLRDYSDTPYKIEAEKGLDFVRLSQGEGADRVTIFDPPLQCTTRGEEIVVFTRLIGEIKKAHPDFSPISSDPLLDSGFLVWRATSGYSVRVLVIKNDDRSIHTAIIQKQ